MRISGLATGLAAVLLATVPAWAADVAPPDLCAVSGINGKVYGEGGYFDGDNTDSDGSFKGVGSLSMPLGCLLGLQVDAGAGSFGGNEALGVGGHLFMRDPARYLLGVSGTYENWDVSGIGNSIDVWRIGGEAELYVDKLSFEAWAGIEDTSKSNTAVFARLTAAAYVTDDWRMAAGWKHSDNFDAGFVSTEWQMPSAPLSLFGEAEIGSNNYAAVSAGVKFYFGGSSKSLIDRHRQDDPPDGLFDFIGAASAFDKAPIDNCALDGVNEGVCTDETLTP